MYKFIPRLFPAFSNSVLPKPKDYFNISAFQEDSASLILWEKP